MRSTLFLGLFVAGFGTAALAGCGSDTTGTGGGGTGGSTTTTTSGSTTTTNSTTTNSTTTNSTTTNSTVTTSSTTTTVSGCASTFATAQDITVSDQNPTACTLDDPSGGAHFFKFTGTKGQAIVIQTTAKVGSDPFDTTYLDTVVTLHDSTMKQLAQNDDPNPRYTNDAELWTILPADGDYVVQVQECNGAFPMNCADPSLITTFDYEIQIFETDGSAQVVTSEIMVDGSGGDFPNDASDPTALTGIKYVLGTTDYGISRLLGKYDTTSDVDVYSFTLPFDTTVNADGRALANFFPFVSGTSGDGSTTPMGRLSIVDPLDPTHVVAEVDASVGLVAADIGAPLTLDKEYYLFVRKPTGGGANDFYVINHYGGGSNPIELLDTANNLPATAEALTDSADPNFLAAYFVDGNLSPAATDVDFYSLTVPSGAATVSVACGAQRSGSGLRSMKFSLHQTTAGNPQIGATETDVPDEDVFIDKAPVPAGATKILLKIAGATQDATVTSNFYRCGARFE